MKQDKTIVKRKELETTPPKETPEHKKRKNTLPHCSNSGKDQPIEEEEPMAHEAQTSQQTRNRPISISSEDDNTDEEGPTSRRDGTTPDRQRGDNTTEKLPENGLQTALEKLITHYKGALKPAIARFNNEVQPLTEKKFKKGKNQLKEFEARITEILDTLTKETNEQDQPNVDTTIAIREELWKLKVCYIHQLQLVIRRIEAAEIKNTKTGIKAAIPGLRREGNILGHLIEDLTKQASKTPPEETDQQEEIVHGNENIKTAAWEASMHLKNNLIPSILSMLKEVTQNTQRNLRINIESLKNAGEDLEASLNKIMRQAERGKTSPNDLKEEIMRTPNRTLEDVLSAVKNIRESVKPKNTKTELKQAAETLGKHSETAKILISKLAEQAGASALQGNSENREVGRPRRRELPRKQSEPRTSRQTETTLQEDQESTPPRTTMPRSPPSTSGTHEKLTKANETAAPSIEAKLQDLGDKVEKRLDRMMLELQEAITKILSELATMKASTKETKLNKTRSEEDQKYHRHQKESHSQREVKMILKKLNKDITIDQVKKAIAKRIGEPSRKTFRMEEFRTGSNPEKKSINFYLDAEGANKLKSTGYLEINHDKYETSEYTIVPCCLNCQKLT